MVNGSDLYIELWPDNRTHQRLVNMRWLLVCALYAAQTKLRNAATCALLGCPTPAAGVADVARLLPGATRTTRIHVLSFTACIPTSIVSDPILGSVLLLAGHGLLMVVRRSRLTGCSVFGAHIIPPALHLAATAADLLRSVVHTIRDGLRIGLPRLRRLRKRVLVFGRAVANALLGTGAIGGADSAFGRADILLTLFVLTGRSAGLAHVDE
jgi:hypothetical protein